MEPSYRADREDTLPCVSLPTAGQSLCEVGVNVTQPHQSDIEKPFDHPTSSSEEAYMQLHSS